MTMSRRKTSIGWREIAEMSKEETAARFERDAERFTGEDDELLAAFM